MPFELLWIDHPLKKTFLTIINFFSPSPPFLVVLIHEFKSLGKKVSTLSKPGLGNSLDPLFKASV
jgi:hypothetical protein